MTKLQKLLQSVTTAPYRGLPQLLFVYILLSFFYHPLSPFHSWHLPDPDDYMRLVRVIDWINGQGWYDFSVQRMGADAPVIIYWSRLVDIPLAALISLFRCIDMEIHNAAMLSALLFPLVLLALLLRLVPALSWPLLRHDHANLTMLILPFALPALYQFLPGRADHHAYQLLFAGLEILCLTRLYLAPHLLRYAVIAGITGALALWVGAEGVPWILLFCGMLGGLTILRGNIMLRPALVFALTFAIASIGVRFAALPPDSTDMSVSWYSLAYFLFALLLAAWIALAAAATKLPNLPLRGGLVALLGAGCATIFLHFVPVIAQGIYGSYEADAMKIIDGYISEARPWISSFKEFYWSGDLIAQLFSSMGIFIFLPSVALIVATTQSLRTRGHVRMIWLIHLAFVASAFALTMFWQIRVVSFASLFSVMPVTWLMLRGARYAAQHLQNRKLFAAELMIFALCAPLPVILLPAFYDNRSFAPAIAWFPAQRRDNPCDMRATAEYLAAPWNYGDRPRMILNDIGNGPELLFRTPHDVMSGPYNSPASATIAAFFGSTDDKAAWDIVQRSGVELVVVCDNRAMAYIKLANQSANPSTDEPDRVTLAERMIGLKHEPLPDWLKRVPIAFSGNYKVFEIVAPAAPDQVQSPAEETP